MSTITIHQRIPLPPTPLALAELLTIAHAANPTLIETQEISEPTADTYVLAFTLAHLFAELGMPKIGGVLRLRTTSPGVHTLDGVQEGILSHLTALAIEIHSEPAPEATIDCTFRVLPDTPSLVVQAVRRIVRKAANNTALLAASLNHQRDLDATSTGN